MKCELCHQKDAETAIQLEKDGEEQELYVCRECANRERVRRQKKSQRTRKGAGEMPPGVSISVSGVSSGDEPPPIVAAIMNAVSGLVEGLEQAAEEAGKAKKKPELADFPCERAEAAYRIGDRLHLEGLHLIGELEPVHRAMKALRLELVGILKNCRLLSPGELFDLLSPLRLAAIEKMLDGITLGEIEKMLASIDLSSKEDGESQQERDRIDAERADEMNRRFEDVVLNERAEEKFL